MASCSCIRSPDGRGSRTYITIASSRFAAYVKYVSTLVSRRTTFEAATYMFLRTTTLMSTVSAQGWVDAYYLARAQKRILLVAAISSMMFGQSKLHHRISEVNQAIRTGIYIATFFLAIWSSHIDMSSSSLAQRCIRWTAAMTYALPFKFHDRGTPDCLI